jgi:hypothetical protein
MSPQVILQEPEEATVDDVTLIKGDTENPAELTDDQVKRLKAVPGVKVAVAGEQEDPIDALKGEALKNAIERAGVVVEGNATVEQKREALKAKRDEQEGSGN